MAWLPDSTISTPQACGHYRPSIRYDHRPSIWTAHRAWHRRQLGRAQSRLRLAINGHEVALFVALDAHEPRRCALFDRRQFMEQACGACDLCRELARYHHL